MLLHQGLDRTLWLGATRLCFRRVGDARRGADDGFVEPSERCGEPARVEAHTSERGALSRTRPLPLSDVDFDAADESRRSRDLRFDRARRSLEEDEDASRVQDVERARLQLGAKEQSDEVSGVVGLDREGPCGLREWVQTEARANDQRESSLRAADEAREVVARDVLDDLPASAGDGPVCEHERDPEDEIAGRPVAVSQRPGEVLCEQRADGRVAGWIERKALVVLADGFLQGGEPHACLDRARQVAGFVLEDPVELVGGQLLANRQPPAFRVRRCQRFGRFGEARWPVPRSRASGCAIWRVQAAPAPLEGRHDAPPAASLVPGAMPALGAPSRPGAASWPPGRCDLVAPAI